MLRSKNKKEGTHTAGEVNERAHTCARERRVVSMACGGKYGSWQGAASAGQWQEEPVLSATQDGVFLGNEPDSEQWIGLNMDLRLRNL